MSLVRRTQGFSLIELMMSVAIIGILASIAIPAYNQYLVKGYIKSAQSDLITLSLQMENYYQRKLKYPTLTSAVYYPKSSDPSTPKWNPTSSDWTADTVPWVPSTIEKFTYSITSTDTSFTLTATGNTGSIVNSASGTCSMSINYKNARVMSNCNYTDATSW